MNNKKLEIEGIHLYKIRDERVFTPLESIDRKINFAPLKVRGYFLLDERVFTPLESKSNNEMDKHKISNMPSLFNNTILIVLLHIYMHA